MRDEPDDGEREASRPLTDEVPREAVGGLAPAAPGGASPGMASLDSPATRVLAYQVGLEALAALRAGWSAAGQRVVLTNGCFDLLHAGHVQYLAAARALGDVLIVAINDDSSVARLKGPGRPLQSLEDRSLVLAALRAVDAVVAFDGDTAVDVVRAVRPDVYVKGGDYGRGARRPPEADVAEALGASVAFLPYVEGRSTTGLLRRLRELGG